MQLIPVGRRQYKLKVSGRPDIADVARLEGSWHIDAKSWQMHGTLWDGKGEPGQSNAVSHGCPPARFHNIDILNVNARGKT